MRDILGDFRICKVSKKILISVVPEAAALLELQKVCQSGGICHGQAVDPCASYPWPYRRQLYCISGIKAAVFMFGGVRRSYHDRGCEGLYGYADPWLNFG